MPLKKVDVAVNIEGSTAFVDIDLKYFNSETNSPIECTYVFPLEASTLLAKFKAKIGDKEVNTKIVDQQKAEERFEDALAAGQMAIMATRKSRT